VWGISVAIALKSTPPANIGRGIHPYAMGSDGKTLATNRTAAFDDHWSMWSDIHPVALRT
jgi:hypothetical protein